MYANTLLDAYKNAKKYTQDKQIATDLNLPKQRISEMRSGKRYIADSEAIFLAENAGINLKEALLGIHADRNENPKIKALWEDMLAKMKSHGTAIIKPETLAISGLVLFTAPYAKCAQCILC